MSPVIHIHELVANPVNGTSCRLSYTFIPGPEREFCYNDSRETTSSITVKYVREKCT